MLRKVEGRSTFLTTRNATIAVAKWSITREFFLATCNATFVALQVARKIASCNMALSEQRAVLYCTDGPLKFKVFLVAKLLRDLSPNFLKLYS